MIDNKELVQKTKEFLSQKNINIKTSDIYELYSYLSNEKSWNIASSKKINFNEKLNLVDSQTHDIKDLFKDLNKNGVFLIEQLLKNKNIKVIERKNNAFFNFKCERNYIPKVIVGNQTSELVTQTILVSYYFDEPYYFIGENKYNIEFKHLSQLASAMKEENAKLGVLITSSKAIPENFRHFCKINMIELLDPEDFFNFFYN